MPITSLSAGDTKDEQEQDNVLASREFKAQQGRETANKQRQYSMVVAKRMD